MMVGLKSLTGVCGSAIYFLTASFLAVPTVTKTRLETLANVFSVIVIRSEGGFGESVTRQHESFELSAECCGNRLAIWPSLPIPRRQKLNILIDAILLA